jgi:hypothetical protein
MVIARLYLIYASCVGGKTNRELSIQLLHKPLQFYFFPRKGDEFARNIDVPKDVDMLPNEVI